MSFDFQIRHKYKSLQTYDNYAVRQGKVFKMCPCGRKRKRKKIKKHKLKKRRKKMRHRKKK